MVPQGLDREDYERIRHELEVEMHRVCGGKGEGRGTQRGEALPVPTKMVRRQQNGLDRIPVPVIPVNGGILVRSVDRA